MTIGPDLLLDDNGDLDFSTGDLKLGISVSQCIAIRLKYFLGEWFLDLDKGLPYFQQVFVKPADPTGVAGLMRKTILDTPGVSAVTSFDYEFDNVSRTLTLTFAVIVDGTSVSGTEVIEL